MPDIDLITEYVFNKKYVGGTDSGVFWKKYYKNKCKNLTFTNEDKVTDAIDIKFTAPEDAKVTGKITEIAVASDITVISDRINGLDFLSGLLKERVEIKFAKLCEDVKIPTKRDEDAGMDVYAYFTHDNLTIPPHKTVKIPTGLKSAFSDNFYIKLTERGSTGSIGIGQRAGVIDAGYRGEWFVPLTNTGDEYIVITKDEVTVQNKQAYAEALGVDFDKVILYPYTKAICQAIVHLNFKTNSKEVTNEEILAVVSERGTGALGSSGK